MTEGDNNSVFQELDSECSQGHCDLFHLVSRLNKLIIAHFTQIMVIG